MCVYINMYIYIYVCIYIYINMCKHIYIYYSQVDLASLNRSVAALVVRLDQSVKLLHLLPHLLQPTAHRQSLIG